MGKRRVAIIGCVGVPAKYGGFETLAEHLVRELAGRFDITVYCSAERHEERQKTWQGARLVYVPLRANGPQSVLYDVVSAIHSVAVSQDVLLVLGVSGAAIVPFLKWGRRSPVILHVDGVEWMRAKWGRVARTFLHWSERVGARHASAVVADNAEIERRMSAEYGITSTLIEYGGDHVLATPPADVLTKLIGRPLQRYAFSVCRIEPENNVHVLVEAFSTSLRVPLVIVGNWSQSEYGRSLRARAHAGRVIMLDAIYDPHVLGALRSNCDLYVHGHSAGGTNPSLVEAMSLHLPVFAYDVAYNRETTENAARYFRTAGDLVDLVNGTDENELRSISVRMGEIADRRYRWDRIAGLYAKLIDRVATESGVRQGERS